VGNIASPRQESLHRRNLALIHGNKQGRVPSVSLCGVDDGAVVEQPMLHSDVPVLGGQHQRGLAIGGLEIAEACRVRVVVQKGGRGSDVTGVGMEVEEMPGVGERIVVDWLHVTGREGLGVCGLARCRGCLLVLL